jgi:hypothetical protein
MKVCIIGFPRSRSSILLETISIYYGIEILGEDINLLNKRYGDTYLKLLRNFLTKHQSKKDGVIRLHPLQMMSDHPFSIINFDWFNFKQYDKIYFTFRESIIDNIASAFVADRLQYTYKSKDQLSNNVKFCFTNNDIRYIRDHFRSAEIVNSLKQYLEINNIDSIDLYYDNISEYLAYNFPNVTTSHVKTDYDYKTMIVNYSEIEQYYNNYDNKQTTG